MTTAQIIILVTVCLYLLFMIVVGFICSRGNNTVGDFYLGGRKLGPLVTAMSAEASDMSSYLLMGLPGLAYATGICDVGWTAVGLAIGTYANWLLVAKRLRNYTAKTSSITLPDFFANRWHDEKKILTGIAALIILIFFIPYTASGFAACGKLFNSLFGINYHVAMIICAIIIISYTCTGGFLAASHTDLIQSIVMTIALVIVLFKSADFAGGWDHVIENAKSLTGFLSMGSTHNSDTGGEDSYGIVTIVSTLAWGLGYFGMPHILLRFMAIRDSAEIKVSRRIASIWVVFSLFVAIVIGVIGRAITATGAIEYLEDTETIIVRIADLMSQNGLLLAIIAGLIISGIFACTMSTADSQLLASSSSMSENLIRGMLGVKMSDKVAMYVARSTLLIIAAIAMVIAWNPDSSVFGIVSFAWAGFGATFGPVVLCALFWKRSNKFGAISGIVVAGIVVFVWKYLIRPMGGSWDIYELLPAFIAGLVAIIVVSLLTAKPDKKIEEEFESVKTM